MADELEYGFECAKCGLSAMVVAEPAYAHGDAELTLEVAACPACDRRRSVPWAGSLLRLLGGAAAAALTTAAYVGSVILSPAAMIAAGVIVGASFTGIGLVAGGVFEVRRWRAGGRVRLVRQLRAPRMLALPPAYVRKI